MKENISNSAYNKGHADPGAVLAAMLCVGLFFVAPAMIRQNRILKSANTPIIEIALTEDDLIEISDKKYKLARDLNEIINQDTWKEIRKKLVPTDSDEIGIIFTTKEGNGKLQVPATDERDHLFSLKKTGEVKENNMPHIIYKIPIFLIPTAAATGVEEVTPELQHGRRNDNIIYKQNCGRGS